MDLDWGIFVFKPHLSWIDQQENWNWVLSMDLLWWTSEVKLGNLKRDNGSQVKTSIVQHHLLLIEACCLHLGCAAQSLCCHHNINSCLFLFLLYPESGGNVSGRESQRLKKRNIQLEEENNLLKLKIEMLLDMVRNYSIWIPYAIQWVTKGSNWFLLQLTETTVEYHLMEKELEDMKSKHQRKK